MEKSDVNLLRLAFVGILIGGAAGAGLGMDALARVEPAPKAETAALSKADAEMAQVQTTGRVQAGQFVVPLLQGGHTEAFLLAEVTLEMASDEATRHAGDTTRIRDLLLRELFEAAEEGVVRPGKADPAQLEKALKSALNAELGTAAVSRIFFDRLLLQDNVQG